MNSTLGFQHWLHKSRKPNINLSTHTLITENLTSNFFRRLVFSVISVYDRKKLVLKSLPEANFTEKKKEKSLIKLGEEEKMRAFPMWRKIRLRFSTIHFKKWASDGREIKACGEALTKIACETKMDRERWKMSVWCSTKDKEQTQEKDPGVKGDDVNANYRKE